MNIGEILFPYATMKEKELFAKDIDLVHYTSAENAYKIIESEEIWLRKASCMNDLKEILYGKNIIFSLLKNNSDIQYNFNNLIQLINNHFKIDLSLDDFKINLYKLIDATEHYVYLTCLSEHENTNNIGRLSMWRAYGHPNGVALIVNKAFMKNAHNNTSNIFLTSPVLYTETNEKIVSLFNEVINNISNKFEYVFSYIKSDANIDEVKKIIEYTLFQIFYVSTISIKHPGFEEEREWRIIYSLINETFAKNFGNRTPGLKEKNETINNLPQKIFTLNLKEVLDIKYGSSIPALLKKIIIGPTAHPEIIKESFVDLLKKKNIPNPENLIEISNIPLRV